MTPHQILLVKTSFQAALTQRERIAGFFFAELFAREPAMWQLLRGKTGMRWPALVDGLAAIVGSIHRIHSIEPVLQWLSWQGAVRGVGEGQYEAVGQALVAALEAGLGEAFGSEHRRAWMVAVGKVADIMARALEEQPMAA